MLSDLKLHAEALEQGEEAYLNYLATVLTEVDTELVNRNVITKAQSGWLAAVARRVKRKAINKGAQ